MRRRGLLSERRAHGDRQHDAGCAVGRSGGDGHTYLSFEQPDRRHKPDVHDGAAFEQFELYRMGLSRWLVVRRLAVYRLEHGGQRLRHLVRGRRLRARGHELHAGHAVRAMGAAAHGHLFLRRTGSDRCSGAVTRAEELYKRRFGHRRGQFGGDGRIFV